VVGLKIALFLVIPGCSRPLPLELGARRSPLSVTAPSKPNSRLSTAELAPTKSRLNRDDEKTVGQQGKGSAFYHRQLNSAEIWRSSSGLTAPIEVGPDGALYLATRYGMLEVVERTGKLRFSVSLDGPTMGPIYVDAKGNAFAATGHGTVVGVSAQGQRLFTYPSLVGVRRGLSFSATYGLLYLGQNDVILGVNRVGFPIFRFDSPWKVTVGPFEQNGFCVVGTNTGKLLGISRMKRRFVLEFKDEITQVASTDNGGLWVLAGTNLVAVDSTHRRIFERSGILRVVIRVMTQTLNANDQHAQGVQLSADGKFDWLHSTGKSLAQQSLKVLDQTLTAEHVSTLALDDANALWLVAKDSSVFFLSAAGSIEKSVFDEPIDSLTVSPKTHETFVALRSGKILAVSHGVEKSSGKQPTEARPP
jgi:hypothetical protein